MRSVVVVLPASMWAMIPMLRVFSRVNLRGIASLFEVFRGRGEGGVVGLAVSGGESLAAGKKMGPLWAPARCGWLWTALRRYVLRVSIWSCALLPAPRMQTRLAADSWRL